MSNQETNPPVTAESIDELQEKRRELEQKIQSIKQDFKNGLSQDSGERAVELENAEVLNEIMRVSEKQLADINEKLLQQGNPD